MARRCCEPGPPGASPISRRAMLAQAGLGFGAWALLDLLRRDGLRAWTEPGPGKAPGFVNPLAAKPPHFPATAKHVIFLFIQGGPSHIDTFDPKPLPLSRHGQPFWRTATPA